MVISQFGPSDASAHFDAILDEYDIVGNTRGYRAGETDWQLSIAQGQESEKAKFLT